MSSGRKRDGHRHAGAACLARREDTRHHQADRNLSNRRRLQHTFSFSLQYDDNDDWPARPSVAMWFDFTILDDFLRDWAKMQRELQDGELSREQYFEWKIRWPEKIKGNNLFRVINNVSTLFTQI